MEITVGDTITLGESVCRVTHHIPGQWVVYVLYLAQHANNPAKWREYTLSECEFRQMLGKSIAKGAIIGINGQ